MPVKPQNKQLTDDIPLHKFVTNTINKTLDIYKTKIYELWNSQNK